jgi:hypothetical protein
MQIGKLKFNRKALRLIILCLFLNGVIIGAMVAFKQDGGGAWAVPFGVILMFSPYVTLRKEISKNIAELK